jgi:glyoxylase-like metal-dependent hydrolase (beta-lactamase superfamily II)
MRREVFPEVMKIQKMPRFLKLCVALVLLATGIAFAQQPLAREITKIAGDVYRFGNSGHFSVFMVTPAGIVVTDPINAEAARWLKQELAKRFNQPVRYVIYSHDHADHISGGEVFTDTAIVVAHEKAKEVILGEKRPTAAPQVVFSDRITIELGGKLLELIYTGRNHSDNSIVIRFPAERVLFAVDFVTVNRLPFRDFPDAYIEDWIESLKRVESLEFDILAPGHGPLGRKEDVVANRLYLEELRAEVLKHIRAGKSLDEIKQSVKMEKYRSWASYDEWLPLNIEGMYRHLSLHRRPN